MLGKNSFIVCGNQPKYAKGKERGSENVVMFLLRKVKWENRKGNVTY
jgi:hypothetical protein